MRPVPNDQWTVVRQMLLRPLPPLTAWMTMRRQTRDQCFDLHLRSQPFIALHPSRNPLIFLWGGEKTAGFQGLSDQPQWAVANTSRDRSERRRKKWPKKMIQAERSLVEIEQVMAEQSKNKNSYPTTDFLLKREIYTSAAETIGVKRSSGEKRAIEEVNGTEKQLYVRVTTARSESNCRLWVHVPCQSITNCSCV